jgi:hypothetical protein
MNEDILFIGGFFFTVIVVTLGFPIVRMWTKRKEMEPLPGARANDDRLARLETAIDTMAVELERISEGQRFITKLLAEREQARTALPSPEREARP